MPLLKSVSVIRSAFLSEVSTGKKMWIYQKVKIASFFHFKKNQLFQFQISMELRCKVEI